MKKLLSLIASLAIIACAQIPNEATKTVVFTLAGVESGSLTKSLADDVSAAVVATAPDTDAEIIVQSTTKTARTYVGCVGEPITLAYDSYHVYGEYRPASHGTIFYSTIYREPPYTVEGDITVTDADESYPLDVAYNCFALVIDYSKVSSVELSNSNKVFADCTDEFVKVGNIGILYLTQPGSYNSQNPFKVRVYPKDEANYEYAEFVLTASGGSSAVKIEKGKWYCFNPTAVETTSGDFTLTFPSFSEGVTE